MKVDCKLTNKQKIELEIISYFIPKYINWKKYSDEDIKNYFEYCSNGKHKELLDERNFDGFNSLIWGKRWCERHINEMWKKGLNDETITIKEIIVDLPDNVAEYLSIRLK